MAVEFNNDLYDQAESNAHDEPRTIEWKIEFLSMIGKAGLENPCRML